MALDFFSRIVEERILEAQRAGQVDDLPGRGRPLGLDEDSSVPEDLRLAYKILKNAHCLPPEIELRREILRIEDLLASIDDAVERRQLVCRLNFKIMKLNMMRPSQLPIEANRLSRHRG